MEMNAALANSVIVGVMEILEDETIDRNTEKIRACIAALDAVAKWLDMVAEVDEVALE